MRLLVLLMLVVDSYRPWVMLRVMGRRWQALRRVGVMLGGAPSQHDAVDRGR
jgi:DMSO/TMAO reductase YedYZ heme-binding membrane subunit